MFRDLIITFSVVVCSRTRYYQEAREGVYTGPTFLLSQLLASLPLSAFTTCLSAFIIFRGLREEMVCVTPAPDGGETCQTVASLSSRRITEYVR